MGQSWRGAVTVFRALLSVQEEDHPGDQPTSSLSGHHGCAARSVPTSLNLLAGLAGSSEGT